MTVSSEQSRVQYATDGVATSFPVPFRFLQNRDLRVTLIQDQDGTTYELVLDSDYTLSGANQAAGGTLTTTTTLAAEQTLIVERVMSITQETAYQRNDPFPERAHEQALDRLTMIAQQFESWLGTLPGALPRVLHFPIEFPRRQTTLPPAHIRARKALIFDALGNVTVGKDNYEDQAANAAQSASEAAESAASAKSDRQAVEEIANDFGDLNTARNEWETAVQQSQTAASSARTDANKAATAAEIAAAAGRVYQNPTAGVTPPTGVPVGQYYWVESVDSDSTLELWRNVGGIATDTGKRSPSTVYVNNLSDAVSAVDIKMGGKADKIVSPSEEIGGGLVDKEGNNTWLHYRTQDGGPTNTVIRHLQQRMDVASILQTNQDEIGGGLVDSEGNSTWLLWRTQDGGPPDAVVRLLRELILPDGGVSGKNYRVHPVDSALTPADADLLNFSLWGSSSAWYMAPLIAGQVQTLYGANTYNGGVSGQGVESIGARLGSHVAELAFPNNLIPASGTVEVTSSTNFYRFINYYGEISGVQGRLHRSVAGDPLRFTRTSGGTVVPLVGPTPFIPDDGAAHRDSVTLLWMGKNDTSSTGDTAAIVQKVVSYTDEAFNWLAPVNVRALVLGHFINYGSSAAARDQINQINAAHAKRYGPLFVDVQGWLMSPQVWIDLGITPTAQDLSDQADGVIAESQRRDNSHLTDAAYIGIFSFLIRPKIEAELNWF